MSDELITKMSRAFLAKWSGGTAEDGIRAALNVLAENISDDIVFAAIVLEDDPKIDRLREAMKRPNNAETINKARNSIIRAIRKAAE